MILVASLLSFRSSEAYEDGKCMTTVTYSEMAYGQFKKAYKASSADVAKQALKKGLEQAQQTAAYAVQCSCTQAETYSLTAYTLGKKALGYDDLKDIQAQAKKAMDLCMDAMSAALQCNK